MWGIAHDHLSKRTQISGFKLHGKNINADAFKRQRHTCFINRPRTRLSQC